MAMPDGLSGATVPYPVCILAGGLGSRLGPLASDTPKPLVEVAGRPFVLHQLELLARHGVRRVVLCVGYLGEKIEEAVGHQRYDIAISFSYDQPGLDGTLGAIRRALPLLGERFLFLYGDTYLRIDYAGAAVRWASSGLPAMMSVLRNDGRWERSNAVLEDDLVVRYDKASPTPDMEWIDYGLGGLTPGAIDLVDDSVSDLSGLQRELASRRLLFGVEADNRFYDIGTPEKLAETEAFFLGRADLL